VLQQRPRLGYVHHLNCEAIGFTIYYMVGYIIVLCGNKKVETILLLPQCTNLTQGIPKNLLDLADLATPLLRSIPVPAPPPKRIPSRDTMIVPPSVPFRVLDVPSKAGRWEEVL